MNLLEVSDEVLDLIFWQIDPWWWGQWYDLILTCKRFYNVLIRNRQSELLDLIEWKEPEVELKCDECKGELTDKSIVSYEDGWPTWDEMWCIYCSLKCAMPHFPCGRCITCGEEAIRPYCSNDVCTSSDPEWKPWIPKLECLKCNPHALECITVTTRFRPKTDEGKNRLVWQLEDHSHFSPACFVCKGRNLGGCSILTIPTSESGKCIHLTVCGYLCYLKCEEEMDISSVTRPTHLIHYEG